MPSTPVERTYRRLAPIYDVLYGVLLQPGRQQALRRLQPRPGESILEVGAGTGFNLSEYPPACRVVAMDLSADMLAQARARLARALLRHVALCQVDATRLAFADGAFDAVYAPYLINVVPDPVLAVREMLRVCRPGGRVVLLNHFEGIPGGGGIASRLAGWIATRLTDVNWQLEFPALLRSAGLPPPRSVELVNAAHVSAVVVFVMPDTSAHSAAATSSPRNVRASGV
jgi:phosphatidylethanolamine/phosphatidyl-N-methylethanolamine N-methyltransferase